MTTLTPEQLATAMATLREEFDRKHDALMDAAGLPVRRQPTGPTEAERAEHARQVDEFYARLERRKVERSRPLAEMMAKANAQGPKLSTTDDAITTAALLARHGITQ
jgi:sRNA-binding protein